VQADWVSPLAADVWGRRIWTTPPNSQGYLTLAAAWIAAELPLPEDPLDPRWPHLLVEAARAAAFDRDDVLHEHADGRALDAGDRLGPRRAWIDPERAAQLPGESYRSGGTIYLCAVDSDRMGVSLIQSNAAGFGCLLAEPSTGIWLHNRGIGFSLDPTHPAAYGPRRRPPHTLSPAIVTTADGRLDTAVGTMGGDAQPQVVLQLLASMLHHRADVGDAIAAPRWVLGGRPPRGNGFDTWTERGPVQVHVEAEAPESWDEGLRRRGHHIVRHAPLGYNVGHAHAIAVRGESLEGASDPRSLGGAAAGW
jgi:gamma-glutamyltranspeptidase/glutathione hydrolase